MKKILFLVACMLLAANLFALRPGDAAKELVGVRWVSGVPFTLLPAEKEAEKEPEYRAVVFLLTRAQTADDALTLLNYLRRNFAGSARFAVVTPDSEQDVKELLKRRTDFDLSFGVDTKRELTPAYLGANRLLPMAFLVGRDGKILWSGEAIDLGEALEKALNGTLNRSAQQKIAPLLEELQTLLTGDNETKMRRTVDAIFRLEPGQPSTLRIRNFVLESNGRAGEALELTRAQIAQAPKQARLYVEALNLIARNPALDAQTDGVVKAYHAAITNDPDVDNQIARLLLERREYSAESLKNAAILVARAKSLLTVNSSGALRGACLNTQAQLAYRLGKITEAIALQEQASTAFRTVALTGAESDSNRRLAYYRTVQELAR